MVLLSSELATAAFSLSLALRGEESVTERLLLRPCPVNGSLCSRNIYTLHSKGKLKTTFFYSIIEVT